MEQARNDSNISSFKKILPYLLVILLCFEIIIYLLLHIRSQQLEKSSYYSNINYELGMVKSDLQTYNKLSDETINIILKALKETSIKDTVPIGLLHCINRVESEYQFNIVHPTVNVPVNGKMITTNAVGTGGILWCYWGDSLKANNIAQAESDLFFPDKSIRATGYILRWMINDELRLAKKFPTYKKINTMNILTQVIKRYYGDYSKYYMDRMLSITSDLWMRRMANQILNKRDTTANHVLINNETIRK